MKPVVRKITVTLFLTALTATILLCGTVDAAVVVPDSVQTARILTLQDHLYRDNFRSAESLATDFITEYPDHALGYLFKAITLVSAMFDAEENARADHFHALMDTAETLASDVVQATDGTPRAWGFLVLGHCESYRAVWEVRFGSKLSAARRARAGAAHYRRGLIADSTVGDLYFGLGLYHYWKSARAGILRWIGLVADEQELGYSQLHRAAANSLLSRQAARSALIWVNLDRQEYDSSISLAQDFLTDYPESHSLLWPLAQGYVGAGQVAHAAAIYERLRCYYARYPGNYHNLIECDYRLAQCYEELDQPQARVRAVAQASTYLDEVSPRTQDRQKDRLDYLRAAAE